jgi:hypothetical protein
MRLVRMIPHFVACSIVLDRAQIAACQLLQAQRQVLENALDLRVPGGRETAS